MPRLFPHLTRPRLALPRLALPRLALPRLALLALLSLAACSRPPAVSPDVARKARLADYRGDATRGATLFATCRTCHSDVAGVNRTGPSLFAVVGRPAGSVPGFHYSPANRKSGLHWDEATLFRYLLDPQATVPGTFMSYGGLPDPQARADVIAFLATRR